MLKPKESTLPIVSSCTSPSWVAVHWNQTDAVGAKPAMLGDPGSATAEELSTVLLPQTPLMAMGLANDWAWARMPPSTSAATKTSASANQFDLPDNRCGVPPKNS